MAISDVLDIWNAALLNIGAKSALASVGERSAEAAACALRYPSVVRAILRDTDWNCVRRRVGLQEVAAGAVWPPSWRYMYVHPTDCLRVRGFDMGLTAARFPNQPTVDYEIADDAIAGKVILTNVPCPVMIYTRYVVDLSNGTHEANFDASLREAVGWALAAAIAAPLVGSASAANAIKAESRAMIDAARAANANESAPNQMPQDCDSLQARGLDACWPGGWSGPWPWTSGT